MIALAERTAINAPIQGTNADIVKLAMIDIDITIKERGWQDKVFPVLQIHDEIVYEVADDLVKEFGVILKETMESVITRHMDIVDTTVAKTLDIPITVSVEAGHDLNHLESVIQ